MDVQAAVPTATVASLASLSPNGGSYASMAPVRLRVAATGTLRQVLLAVQLQGSHDGAPASVIEVFTVHFEGRSAGMQHAATLQVCNLQLVLSQRAPCHISCTSMRTHMRMHGLNNTTRAGQPP
jgi:hypothetical protein